MIRTSMIILCALLLGLTGGLGPTGAGVAVACEDAHAQAIAATAQTPPRAPRAPRTPHAEPSPPEAPAPAAAPDPQEGLEIPEPPAQVTPRGWFGFGFQCGECFVRTGPGDAAAVWEFGSLPKVYSVDLGGPAARAGIRRGDVITKIDGISILTPAGGRRFGAIRPGQVVKWTVQREGAIRNVVARAGERPDRRERVELRDLRKELVRLNELSDLDELRRELAALNQEMESRRAQEAARERVRVRAVPARRLRYAGVIGNAEVEVRGPGSVIVSETGEKDELIINTGESVVVIRLADIVRKRSGEKPK